MEEQFVPYEIALKLKELGFNEECEATWRQNTEKEWYDPRKGEEITLGNNNIFLRTYIYLGKDDTIKLFDAPLWQQAFDWFRKKNNLFYVIHVHKEGYSFNIHSLDKKGMEEVFLFSTILGSIVSSEYINTYEEARKLCLEKLIEITNENNNKK